MKKHHDIFKDSSLSKDELKNYLSGNLSDIEKAQIEKKIAANDFSMDAAEGFENTPESIAEFEKLSDEFHANLTLKTSKGSKWKFQYTFGIVVILAIALYSVGHYYLLESEKKREAFDEKRRIEKEQIALEKEVIEFEENNKPPIVELSDIEIDEAVSLPVEKQVSSEKVIIESPIKIESIIDSTNNEEIDSIIKEAVEIKEHIEIEPIENIEPVLSPEKNLVISNAKTLFLSELLVVDYSNIYKKGIEKTTLQLSGVSADKENAYDPTSDNMQVDSYTKEIAYVDYLREVQSKFRKNKFKAALKGYKTILSQYPNDLNAHFYSGLCYYNINKLNKAIEHFDRVIPHEFNTFQEEANWYKALSLYELGETSACISLLNKIASSNGFYTEKASKLLEKI